jgi:alpha-ketoglutarate-dependent taurine dioxygenase
VDTSQTLEMRVRRLSPFVGAELSGIDVRSLAADELARVKSLFLEHHLLVISNQTLSDADIQRFAEHFGPLEQNQVRGVDGAVLPAVHRIANVDAEGRPSANPLLKSNYTWHTDKAYLKTPSLMTLLWGEEIPPTGGDTQFVNTEVAYDTLPQPMKERIEGLRVVQSFRHMLDSLGQHDIIRAEDIPPPVEHPLVRTHPQTGRKSLFVANYSSGIVGMGEAEGRQLITELLEHATQEQCIFVQHWKKHDLVIWDNRSLLHRAIPNYDMGKHRRILRRCVVRGDVPR